MRNVGHQIGYDFRPKSSVDFLGLGHHYYWKIAVYRQISFSPIKGKLYDFLRKSI